MNIGKITDVLKATGLFLLANIVGILFILGLGVIVFAMFLVSIVVGYISAGVALIVIALILNSEEEEV